jgi:hypothetical protein
LIVNNFVTRASLQGCPYKSARVSEAALRFLLHMFFWYANAQVSGSYPILQFRSELGMHGALTLL